MTARALSGPSAEALVEALLHHAAVGDVASVLAATAVVPEEGRGRLHERFRDGYRAAVGGRFPARDARADAAVGLVSLCLGPPGEAWSQGVRALEPVGDLAAAGAVVRAVAGRPPRWRERLVAEALGEEFRTGHAWLLVSALAEAGLVATPTTSRHLAWLWDAHLPPGLPAAVARRPRVRDEAWASLRADGTGRRLGGVHHGVDPEAWWRGVVVGLGADAPAGRSRLLDECLLRLGLVRTAPEARGFVGVLDHLAPDDDEVRAREATYVALLAAGCGPAVAVAQAALRRLVRAGTADLALLVEASSDVLARREKGVVRAQVALLRDALAQGADPVATALVLAESLDVDRADLTLVCARLLGAVARRLPAADAEAVRAVVAGRLEAPWPELAAALGAVSPPGAPAPGPAPARVSAPAPVPGTLDQAGAAGAPGADGAHPAGTPSAAAPVPDPPARARAHGTQDSARALPADLPAPGAVRPVAGSEEAAELVAHVLEQPEDATAVELALDAMVRERERPRRAAALAARARARRDAWSEPPGAVGAELADVVLAWLGAPPDAPGTPVGLLRDGFTRRRDEIPPGATVREQTVWRRGAPGRELDGWHWQTVETPGVPVVLVRARLREVRALLAGAPRPGLLAAPSRADGSIDGDVLLARLRRAAVEEQAPPTAPRSRLRSLLRRHRDPGAVVPAVQHDLPTALLRLVPADRAAVLAGGALPPELAAQLAALGAAPSWQRRVTAVGGGRYRWHAVAAQPALWLADGPAGSVDEPVRAWLDTATVPAFWHDHQDDGDRTLAAGLHLWAATLPHAPDLLAAHLQPVLSVWLEKPRAPLAGVAQRLGAAGSPLGGPAASALVWLAACRDVTVRTATAEALAEAAARGTLAGGTLGEQLAAVVGAEPVAVVAAAPKLVRVVATLADAARLGERAEALVLHALLGLAPAVVGVRGAAETVELAAQLAERRGVGVVLPEPLARAARGSSRVAAAARRLAAAGR